MTEGRFTPFNMNDEYEGGYFEKSGFFNFAKEKKKKKQTKDDIIYGIWNEGYEDEDDDEVEENLPVHKKLEKEISGY